MLEFVLALVLALVLASENQALAIGPLTHKVTVRETIRCRIDSHVPRALLPHQLSLGRIIACIRNLYSKVTLLLLCTCSCQLPYWHQGDLFWLFSLPVLCFGSVHLTSHPQQARTAITTTRNLRRSIRTMIVTYLHFHNLGWDTSLKPSKMNHSNHFHNLGCDTFPAKAK